MVVYNHDNVSIKELHKALGDLIKMEHSLDPGYAKEMNKLFKRTVKDASSITGKFLHNLGVTKPDQEVVKKMITAFPSSLSRRYFGRIPVNSAFYNPGGFPYVNLLAKE